MSRRNDYKIYVGNLPPDIRVKDIQDIFHKFGKVQFVDLKNRRGPPFAFVEFDDPRDAEDAVHARGGYAYEGYRLRVEFPRCRGPTRMPRSYSQKGPSRRSQYRVLVSGLPPSGSWQDLKDHMREAGDVCHADVYKDGSGRGVIEFFRYDDMRYACDKLDDSKFRSHEGETSYIRVKADYTGPRESQEDERSSRRRRTPSYSPVRKNDRHSSRSRSRS